MSQKYLIHATSIIGAWTQDTVYEANDNVVFALTIGLDSADKPHIAFFSDALYHAVDDGTQWQPDVIYPLGTSPSLAVGDDGSVHVAYNDIFGKSLRYARCDGPCAPARGCIMTNRRQGQRTGNREPTRDETKSMDREDILHHLDAVGLGAFRDAISERIRPAVRLVSRPARDEDLRVGATRVGGHPDLPRDFEWPSDDDGPLEFVAQLNLDALARYGVGEVLPATGLLSILVSAYCDTIAVHHWTDLSNLVAHENRATYTACGVDPAVYPQVPPPSTHWIGRDAPANVPGSAARMNSEVAIPDELYDRYWDDVWRASIPRHPPEGGVHQCGGYMLSSHYELQALDEVVVFCLATDDNAGMEWGDAQDVWLLAKAEDARQGRFEHIRMCL